MLEKVPSVGGVVIVVAVVVVVVKVQQSETALETLVVAEKVVVTLVAVKVVMAVVVVVVVAVEEGEGRIWKLYPSLITFLPSRLLSLLPTFRLSSIFFPSCHHFCPPTWSAQFSLSSSCKSTEKLNKRSNES